MRGLFVAMLVVPVVVVGCSSKSTDSRRAPQPDLPIDAGVHQLSLGTPPMPVGHLDEDDPRHAPPPPSAARASRPIDVMLRSTPNGAQAAVDGIVLGPTPAYWSGNVDGREHEFTFVLSGHAVARYRFVPIASGTIHARMIPISDDVDAGVPPPEVVPPVARPWDSLQPDAPKLAPDAAAPSPFGPLP